MSQSSTKGYSRNWKQNVVSDVLADKLASEDLAEAFRICHEDFAQDSDFTASAFCQRLAETRPEVELGKQTRMLFLRGVRQHDLQPKSEHGGQAPLSNAITLSAQNAAATSQEQPIPERRRQVRKTTNLIGVYWHTFDQQQNGAMVVENLSLNGCGLHILTPHNLKRGATLRLEFKLDNASESFIRIHGELRWILYDMAGVEFQSPYGIPQVLADYIGS